MAEAARTAGRDAAEESYRRTEAAADPPAAGPAEDDFEGPDFTKWSMLEAAMARLRSATQAARSSARAEQAAYAAATARWEEVARLPIGSLSRLAKEFEEGNEATRANRVRLFFEMFGPTCPGELEVHADGSPGECTEDDCAGGFHLDLWSCRVGEYWCADCEDRFGIDDDADDPELTLAMQEALACIQESFDKHLTSAQVSPAPRGDSR